MTEKALFTRTNEYDAISVYQDWDGKIELRAEDDNDVVYVRLTTDEVKELRKQLKKLLEQATA